MNSPDQPLPYPKRSAARRQKSRGRALVLSSVALLALVVLVVVAAVWLGRKSAPSNTWRGTELDCVGVSCVGAESANTVLILSAGDTTVDETVEVLPEGTVTYLSSQQPIFAVPSPVGQQLFFGWGLTIEHGMIADVHLPSGTQQIVPYYDSVYVLTETAEVWENTAGQGPTFSPTPFPVGSTQLIPFSNAVCGVQSAKTEDVLQCEHYDGHIVSLPLQSTIETIRDFAIVLKDGRAVAPALNSTGFTLAEVQTDSKILDVAVGGSDDNLCFLNEDGQVVCVAMDDWDEGGQVTAEPLPLASSATQLGDGFALLDNGQVWKTTEAPTAINLPGEVEGLMGGGWIMLSSGPAYFNSFHEELVLPASGVGQTSSTHANSDCVGTWTPQTVVYQGRELSVVEAASLPELSQSLSTKFTLHGDGSAIMQTEAGRKQTTWDPLEGACLVTDRSAGSTIRLPLVDGHLVLFEDGAEILLRRS